MTHERSNAEAERRPLLLALYEAAVGAALPEHCLPRHLPEIGRDRRLLVVGAGKAAAAMAQAVEHHYASIGERDRLRGTVATRHGHGRPLARIRLTQAGHPVPDAGSIRAADEALRHVGAAAPDEEILVLLSGGASAIWAAPAAGLSLDDKRATTTALLASGRTIAVMNTVRKHLSRIKGGRLARAANGRRMLTLAISDVPGDDPSVIGSGPTVGDRSRLREARDALVRLEQQVPATVLAALADPRNETVKPGDPCLRRAEYRLVATPRMALEAAATVAARHGYRPLILGDALEGEARDLASTHAALARQHRQRGERVALISGGEVTVTVTGRGRGGSNQEYALALAIGLDGADGIAAIAADTDGSDGGTGAVDDPAGGLVFNSTLARARGLDLNAADFLADNDSGGFFGRLGDLVARGPTYTNVNDFRAILVDP